VSQIVKSAYVFHHFQTVIICVYLLAGSDMAVSYTA